MVEVGQIWCDEDGLAWEVRATQPGYAYVRRVGQRGASIMTRLEWFDLWTLIPDREGSR
jgi:hypothetical protein